MDVIFKRRSVRRYLDKDVPDELIKKILEAGMNAPSAGNEQPWQFIVIKNKQTLAKMAESSPHARALKEASVGIVVCADLLLDKHQGFWVQDCSAAAENMLLEAVALKLGAVWLGVYPPNDRVVYIRKYFSLPNNIVPFAILSIGYPLEEPKSIIRYNQNLVHYEIW